MKKASFGSLGYQLMMVEKNRTKIFSCKTFHELVATCESIINENEAKIKDKEKIDEFLTILKGKRNYFKAMQYINDFYMKQIGLGVIR